MNYAGDNTADPTVSGVYVDVNAPANNIFNSLVQLRDDLNASNHANVRNVDSANISQYLEHLNNIIGTLSVRVQEMDVLRDNHEADSLLKQSMRSQLEDVDAFEAMSNLSNQQVAYQSALQVGARVTPQSLFDFLQ
jgi:flagellar hook-associated protein 3 FlgL